MKNSLLGIHHVTAITDNPQRNIDFYAGILGLRFIKKTVNFDVPGTYHFYYGDRLGQPGTILTFFFWPGYPRGRRGMGQITTISLAVVPSALDYWRERLTQQGIAITGPTTRFGEEVLSFTDHDGLALELVAHSQAEQFVPWHGSLVPGTYGIRGVHSITLSVARQAETAAFLTSVLGFQQVGKAGNRTRYSVATHNLGVLVDVLDLPTERRGMESIGTVHHAAWRTAGQAEQVEWRHKLASLGVNITPIMDRIYFHSIYFREPSGVLFEIATDPPGFLVDELEEELGMHLKLPPWLEPRYAMLQQSLPPVHLPPVEQWRQG